MERSFQIDMPKVETFNKEFVLKQATDVFHDKGFNATSMQDLVDATALNRSSIYNSFGSKLDLFLECLKSYKEAHFVRISETLDKAHNPLHAIELLFEYYLNEIIKDKDDKGCLITNCTSEMANQEPSIINFLCSNQNSFIGFLEDLVRKGQEESAINLNRTPNEYALYLFSSIQGFRTAGILISNKSKLQTIAKTIIQTLI
ncbi:TetR/AcrR family transcriptional regulator [Flavivirga rizhaonensis]|uniref:TetR/AcrR family transcriptional regulator n=1 Tax=Flavivirga rizhaonensis TaxID=2559571 RepID=A0A4S1E0H9_9FLAO|nr:TetR/AcrR family transcriptional regulator [Flavivirga rizhaonensis]TGV04000.1 TetR/AcrR family transcriptional regulator [Flavivirga rizhaonensis]